jgi:hypothetical protein
LLLPLSGLLEDEGVEVLDRVELAGAFSQGLNGDAVRSLVDLHLRLLVQLGRGDTAEAHWRGRAGQARP